MHYRVAGLIAVVAVAALSSAATANMNMCPGNDMSHMSTMISAMPDGQRKQAMYGHLAILNSKMAKGEFNGCGDAMKPWMNHPRRHKLHGSHLNM